MRYIVIIKFASAANVFDVVFAAEWNHPTGPKSIDSCGLGTRVDIFRCFVLLFSFLPLFLITLSGILRNEKCSPLSGGRRRGSWWIARKVYLSECAIRPIIGRGGRYIMNQYYIREQRRYCSRERTSECSGGCVVDWMGGCIWGGWLKGCGLTECEPDGLPSDGWRWVGYPGRGRERRIRERTFDSNEFTPVRPARRRGLRARSVFSNKLLIYVFG